MRGALIHGVLLVVMLVYGYRTWTRDTTLKPDLGSIVLWDKHEADLVSIELKSDKKITRLERRGQGNDMYWWGVETTIEKKVKPPEAKPEPAKPDDAGSGSGAGSGSAAKAAAAGSGAGSGSAAKTAAAGSGAGSGSAAKTAAAGSGAGSGSAAAGSGAGSGSAAKAEVASAAGSAAGSGAGSAAGSGAGSASPPPPVTEEIRKTREFPVGEAADRLVTSYAQARALRDLGKPTEEQQKDYKLNDAKTTLTATFRDGSRSFLVGGSVYGGSDRYVTDPQSGRAYVLSKDLVAPLDGGESGLQLIDPHGFDSAKLETVVIEAGGKSKTATHVQSDVDGQQIRSWGDPVTKKAEPTIQNFIDNANNLRPTEYQPNVKLDDLTAILKLTFKDIRDNRLGTLVLYKHERPGEVSLKADTDPANPPPAETDYLIMTEKTRVPGLVRRDTAQRTEQDIATVFSEHPSIEPKGNPLGNPGIPIPPGRSPHGRPAPEPADSPATGSASGSAAPAKAGAAPPKADAPKAGAEPAMADAPKAGAAPAKADAPKAGAAPAKADAPKGGW